MRQSDIELNNTLCKLAKVSHSSSTGRVMEMAADRILQLLRERYTILHLWYKGREACAVCAHKCTNVEAESCGECKRECMCLACEGENWEEANSDG